MSTSDARFKRRVPPNPENLCEDCGHPIGRHSDIVSYKMSNNQENYPWCEVDGCDCQLAYDDFYEEA